MSSDRASSVQESVPAASKSSPLRVWAILAAVLLIFVVVGIALIVATQPSASSARPKPEISTSTPPSPAQLAPAQPAQPAQSAQPATPQPADGRARVEIAIRPFTGPLPLADLSPAGPQPAVPLDVSARWVELPPRPDTKPFNKDDVINAAAYDFMYGGEQDWEEGFSYLKKICAEKTDRTIEKWRPEAWRNSVAGRLFTPMEIAYVAGHYDLCDRAGAYGVTLTGSQLVWLEKFLDLRIHAKLKLGQRAEALALAKSLYNVCSMRNTSTAIDRVCLALSDPAAARAFRAQQISASTSATATNPMLKNVAIDPAPYLEAAKQVETMDQTFVRLYERGNFMLMADDPAAARQLFIEAYDSARDSREELAAIEGMARTMRAEDGTVGPANAWLQSLRAPESTRP